MLLKGLLKNNKNNDDSFKYLRYNISCNSSCRIFIFFIVKSSIKTQNKYTHHRQKPKNDVYIFFIGILEKIRILKLVNKNYHSIKYALKGDDTTTG